jgi:hypothetical protein
MGTCMQVGILLPRLIPILLSRRCPVTFPDGVAMGATFNTTLVEVGVPSIMV